MNVFNDFIRLLRLEVDIYHNAKICGNWSINEHALGKTCFHIVTKGSCILDIPGYLKTEFCEGDLIIFPREIKHSMHSIDEQNGTQEHLCYSSNKMGTGMLCGEVSIMHLYQNQLLNALPAVLLIKNDENTIWLEQIKTLLLNESLNYERTQSEILNRLSEMLFIYALRYYLEQENVQHGLLALYGDSKLSKAIFAFHQSINFKWNLETLAKQAGMSRTNFSKYFKQKSGWTVNQYTTWWRMQKAWEKLKLGNTINDVSEAVGYQSEAAFSRAFKKQFNKNPGLVRRK